MLLIDEELQFGIMWEYVSQSNNQDFHYGTMKILINGEIFPKKTAFNETLNVIFNNMKQSFIAPYYSAGNTGQELGSVIVDNEALSYGRVPNIFSIGLADLEMCHGGWEGYGSLRLELGYADDKERLFYSEDNGETFREIQLKKGTVEKIVMQLPFE